MTAFPAKDGLPEWIPADRKPACSSLSLHVFPTGRATDNCGQSRGGGVWDEGPASPGPSGEVGSCLTAPTPECADPPGTRNHAVAEGGRGFGAELHIFKRLREQRKFKEDADLLPAATLRRGRSPLRTRVRLYGCGIEEYARSAS